MKAGRSSFQVCRFLLCAFALANAGVLQAATVLVVQPNAVQEVSTSDQNQAFVMYDLREGSTLKFTSTTSRAVYTPIIATNGVVTVDVTIPTQAMSLQMNFRGSLVVKGSGAVIYKSAMNFLEFSTENIAPILDVASWRFVKANGSDWENGGLISVCGACGIFQTPANCNWNITAPWFYPWYKNVRIVGADVRYPSVLSVPDQVGLSFFPDAAPDPDCTVRVLAGGTLSCKTYGYSLSDNLRFAEDGSANLGHDMTLGCNVELADETAMMIFSHATYVNFHNVTWTGRVTGVGSVVVNGTVASGAKPTRFGAGADVQSVVSAQTTAKLVVDAGARVANWRGSEDGSAVIQAAEGAQVGMSVGDVNAWKREVSHWFDPSVESSVHYPGQDRKDETYKDKTDSSGYPLKEAIVDCRDASAPISLATWNHQYSDWHAGAVGFLFPSWVPYGKNDLHYLSMRAWAGDFANGTGFPVSSGTANNTKQVTVAAKLVTMVFGSQNGGGKALIGTTGRALERTGGTVHDGLTTNEVHAFWVDGQSVVPTARETLNGSWNVVSIDTAGLAVGGFGWIGDSKDKDMTCAGGQNYGEILIFTNEVATLSRREAEAYLGEKWDIPCDLTGLDEMRYAVGTNRTTLSGKGTYSVRYGTFEMGGAFAGSMALDKARLTLLPGASFGAAVLTGNGEIITSDVGNLANLSTDFVGVVGVKGTDVSLDMTLNPETDEVAGAMIVPEAVLDVSATAVINLSRLAGPLGRLPREWTLVQAKGFAREVTWTLVRGAHVGAAFSLDTSVPGVVKLKYSPQGMMVNLR